MNPHPGGAVDDERWRYKNEAASSPITFPKDTALKLWVCLFIEVVADRSMSFHMGQHIKS